MGQIVSARFGTFQETHGGVQPSPRCSFRTCPSPRKLPGTHLLSPPVPTLSPRQPPTGRLWMLLPSYLSSDRSGSAASLVRESPVRMIAPSALVEWRGVCPLRGWCRVLSLSVWSSWPLVLPSRVTGHLRTPRPAGPTQAGSAHGSFVNSRASSSVGIQRAERVIAMWGQLGPLSPIGKIASGQWDRTHLQMKKNQGCPEQSKQPQAVGRTSSSKKATQSLTPRVV